MANRPSKSGLAAEEDKKLQSKFDEEIAGDVMLWLSEMLGDEEMETSGEKDKFHETLRDGIILCRLANVLKPNSIAKIVEDGSMFHYMANIDAFLKVAKTLGVADQETFQTTELIEGTNLYGVLCCLLALGRKAYEIPGLKGFGIKESKGEKREWTKEQMKAGDTVLSLQYGSNKGANQRGMNFGNTRHI
ncbi:unnamed protein product [Gordionus sp. m RMFG-2023]|uniref:myophilin-like n=1 Tax=Gordionus sp. m RMFG-2023 TaxID=3053472 RepID=UPI0030DED297